MVAGKLLIIILITFVIEALAFQYENIQGYDKKRELQKNGNGNNSSPVQTNLNCEIFDDFMNSTCLKCADKFLLPDCKSCPLGQQVVNNQCKNCGQNQLFCDSSNSQDYCYQGFQKVGDQCICSSDKQIIGNWCTKQTDLIFSAYFQLEEGRIVCQFSSKIYISDPANTGQYLESNQNCDILTNYSTKFGQNPSVTCQLDPDFFDKVYIKFNDSSFSLKLWNIIPEFDVRNLIGNDGSGTFIFTSLTYQPSQLVSASIQQPYFSLNDFTPKLCTFISQGYYFVFGGDNYPLTPSQFTREENFFSQSGPSFSVVESLSLGLTTGDEQSIIEVLGSTNYPQEEAILPSTFFSAPNKSITLSFVCLYPFSLVSSNTVTIKSVKNLDSQCNTKIISDTNNSDEIQIQISCQFIDFTASDNDIFNIHIIVYDTQSIVKEDNTQKKFIEFPYTYSIPPYLLDPTLKYQISITPRYSETTGQQTQIPIPVKRKEIDVQILITNTDNIDPRQVISIKGSIDNSAVQVQDQTLYQYQWSCFDEITKQNCLDDQKNVIVFDYTQSVSIKSNALEYNGVYTITLIGSYSDTDSKTVTIIINTIKGSVNPLTVVYDPTYDSNEIDPNELLKFTLQYNDSDKLKASYLNHSFEFGYNGNLPSQITQNSQKENVIYTQIIQNILEQDLSVKLMFYIRFFLIDQNCNIVGVTRRKYFNTESPPYDCQIVIDTQITGNEIAFVDKIRIIASNCKSSLQDGILLYQFLYLNDELTGNQQQQYQDLINKNYDKYLTKFSEINMIETYLPTGKNTFVLIVKDSNEIQAPRFSTTIVMKQNSFNQQQYEDFLGQEEQNANNFKDNSQFEEQFCTYAMMLECIVDFEKNNQQIQPTNFVNQIKEELRDQFLILPSEIPNNLNSHTLQEYVLRCLGFLYGTLNAPDQSNLLKRLDDVDDLVNQSIAFMKSQTLFVAKLRSTYRKKMLVALDIVNDNIVKLSASAKSTPSVNWSSLQISDVFSILESLALTLYTNQQAINWETSIFNVQVQKVDQFNLFKNYLDYNMQTYGNSHLDNDQIYNVEIQNWKDNIYSFEQSYKDLTQPYLLKATTSEMKDILMKTYPAVYPRVSKGSQDKRLRFLEEDVFLQLPANINSQFYSLTGNEKVKCTQRIKDVWTKSSCVTKVTRQGDTFQVTCSCPTPNYTSLVADVNALFDNPNINHIFSESGISSILSMQNWYQYATIYVIIALNISMIATFIIGAKLDKLAIASTIIIQGVNPFNSQQTAATIPTALVIGNMQIQTNREKTTSITAKIQDQNWIDSLQKCNDKKDNKQNSIIFQDQDGKQNSIILEDQNTGSKVMRNQEKTACSELQKEANQETLKSDLDKENALNQPKKLQQSNPQIKLEGQTNSQILIEIEASCNKEEEKEQYNVCHKFRVGYVECKNLNQHKYQIKSDTKNLQISHEQLEIITHKSQLTDKERVKFQDEEKKRLKREKNIEIQKKSYDYLSRLSELRGVCLFHDLLQIFIVYDQKESRLYRFSIFYNELIWLLALNAAFGEDITIVQVIALSIVSSVCFGILKVLLKFFMNKKKLEYIGYILIFAFLVFCYYSILVVMSSSKPSVSNGWIINYVIAQCFDIFISGFISSAIKYFCTLKLLPQFPITHFIYRFTSADVLFGMFSY